MGKTIDFVYFGANCPSDGCPEYPFEHRSSFNDRLGTEAFARARQIIERHECSPKTKFQSVEVSIASPLRTENEISDFVSKIIEIEPSSQDVMTIDSCKHGKILYQKSIRFRNVGDTAELVEIIRRALPFDLIEKRRRQIES